MAHILVRQVPEVELRVLAEIVDFHYRPSAMTTPANHHHQAESQPRVSPARLEALSDGVVAIVITIMVLEMTVPHTAEIADLFKLWPVFLAYVLSFTVVGIYWNNHHYLLRLVKRVTAGVMWANLHLLFWLSLIPFVTNWLGEHEGRIWPTTAYGVVLLMCAIAYMILQLVICRHHGRDSELATSLGSDIKGRGSIAAYVVGIVSAFFFPWLSYGLYAAVAVAWLIPDRRTRRVVES